MACRTETKTIGEHEYSATQWNAQKAMIMKLKLIKLLGTSIAAITAGFDKDEENEIEAIGSAIDLLFNNGSPEEIFQLIKDCVMGVACDGTRLTDTSFNSLFEGDNLFNVYPVFFFVAQVNYGNLLKGPWVDALKEKVKALQ
jgi:hypothetical protein